MRTHAHYSFMPSCILAGGQQLPALPVCLPAARQGGRQEGQGQGEGQFADRVASFCLVFASCWLCGRRRAKATKWARLHYLIAEGAMQHLFTHPVYHPTLQLPTAVLSTTARAKARAAKKAKEAGKEPGAAGEAMETDKPAGEGAAAEGAAAGDKAEGEGKKEAEPEPSSFTGGLGGRAGTWGECANEWRLWQGQASGLVQVLNVCVPPSCGHHSPNRPNSSLFNLQWTTRRAWRPASASSSPSQTASALRPSAPPPAVSLLCCAALRCILGAVLHV